MPKRDLPEIRKQMQLSVNDVAQFLATNAPPGKKRDRLMRDCERWLTKLETGDLKDEDLQKLFGECLFIVFQGVAGWLTFRQPHKMHVVEGQ